jgi:hypothetical protein
MAESIFNRRGFPVMSSDIDMSSALQDEAQRNKYFPRWRSLFSKFEDYLGKKDSKFSSDWEENTGLDWEEWGKL